MNGSRATPFTVAAQRGAAALEFALVLPIMLILLYGLVTFGSALYTQMVVSRAAEDGVRAVATISDAGSYSDVTEAQKAQIRNEVIDSLANSTIVPSGSGGSYAARHTWLENNVLAAIIVDNGTCGGGASTGQILRVSFAYPFAATRMLPAISLPVVGNFSSWMPATLTGCAIVEL